MTYPGDVAALEPDRLAVRVVSAGPEGAVDVTASLSYGELDAMANRFSHVLRYLGVQVGDHIALVVDNDAIAFPLAWAAVYAGVYFTPVNWRLHPDEIAYVVEDCEAKVVVVASRLTELAAGLTGVLPDHVVRLSVGGRLDGYDSLDERAVAAPADPLPNRIEGRFMFYSSGTTGRPKGIVYDMPLTPLGDGSLPGIGRNRFELSSETRYLCPAPLYHAAGLGWCLEVQRSGGEVVVMTKFDAETMLRTIETFRITHAQLVPTMFVRLLRLDPETRAKYDLSSLRLVIHAAAPCPVPVKREIIDWLGPIVLEYYSGTEGVGSTFCTSAEWLARPGTVGRLDSGQIKICAPDGSVLPAGEVGAIYFANAGGVPFRYFNDPEKTAASYHTEGWATLGDIGHVDEDGWLYITDRKSFVIVSGGVNIYPREIEDVLITHPDVADVAVIGLPDEEYGQRVHAVVEPMAGVVGDAELERQLITWVRDRIAHFKCPRTIDFRATLPRRPDGKLHKRELVDEYKAAEAGQK